MPAYLQLSLLRRHVLTNALYLSALYITFTVLTYVFGWNVYSFLHIIASFVFTWGLLVVFLFRAASGYATEFDSPMLPYWVAVIVLFLTGLIALYLHELFYFILNTVIDPDYPQYLLTMFKEKVLTRIPEEVHEEVLERMAQVFDPAKKIVTNLYSFPIVTLICSVVMAFFVRKNKKYQSNTL